MQTLTFYHEKIGKLVFQGEAENSLVYDREIITEIFFKGINYLVAEGALTTADRSIVENFINKMEIAVNESLTEKSSISYQVDETSGEVICASYFIFSHTYSVPVVDMINRFLDDLCQIIVLLKHPQEDLHGAGWAEYAQVLLPAYY